MSALINYLMMVRFAWSHNAIQLRTRGFEMRWMTWRATSGSPSARDNVVRSDGGERGGALSLPDPSGAGGAPRLTLHARRVIHRIYHVAADAMRRVAV